MRLDAMITLPHGVRREILRHLTSLDATRFAEILAEVTRRMLHALSDVAGARPTLYVQQRHYLSQRSQPTTDAALDFDLRTLVKTEGAGVKIQPEWAAAAFQVIASKRSNIQMGIGAHLPYTSPVVRSRKVIDAVASAWVACEPWLREGLGIR
jgi:hypothetical protein